MNPGFFHYIAKSSFYYFCLWE